MDRNTYVYLKELWPEATDAELTAMLAEGRDSVIKYRLKQTRRNSTWAGLGWVLALTAGLLVTAGALLTALL